MPGQVRLSRGHGPERPGRLPPLARMCRSRLLPRTLMAKADRYPWTPIPDRRPIVEAPVGITFVAHENPPGVTTEHRVDFWSKTCEGWFNPVKLTAHDHGGHFIPWEVPDAWVDDLRRTFRDRRRPAGPTAPAIGPRAAELPRSKDERHV